jgi:8-oxo-dGTP diphosphatase
VNRVAVAIALVWRDGRLLVTKRAKAAHLGGFWEFPGGKVTHGETPEACVVREVQEETRISVAPRSRRELIVWEYPDRVVTLQPVICDWVAGDGECVEVEAVVWCLPAELTTLVFPPANAGLIACLVAEAEASALPRR